MSKTLFKIVAVTLCIGMLVDIIFPTTYLPIFTIQSFHYPVLTFEAYTTLLLLLIVSIYMKSGKTPVLIVIFLAELYLIVWDLSKIRL